jgi:endonuclease-3
VKIVKKRKQGRKQKEDGGDIKVKQELGGKVKVKVEAKDTGLLLQSVDDDFGPGPFPHFTRPYEAECRSVTEVLRKLHGDPEEDWQVHGTDVLDIEVKRVSVLDSLVGTILSQNTTDKTSHRAFASLKERFPNWDSVRTGDPAEVAESIKVGGLSEIKTRRIQNILNAVWEERKECSLEHLRSMSDGRIKEYLSAFKGVGPKTISCVLMFCLERREFPVDVHVWKIAVALGWVPSRANREQTYEHLNRKVPDDVKYALHVLLVQHGKVYNNEVKLLRPCVAKALKGSSKGDHL